MVFSKMIEHRLQVKEPIWPCEEDIAVGIRFDVELDDSSAHWEIEETYNRHITPLLDQLALALLSMSIREIKERHSHMIAWNQRQ